MERDKKIKNIIKTTPREFLNENYGSIYGDSYSVEGFNLMQKHLEETLNKYDFRYYIKDPKSKQVEYVIDGTDVHTSITIYRNYDNNFGRFYIYVYSEKLKPKTQTRTIKDKDTLDNILKQIAEISKVMSPEQMDFKKQIDNLENKLEDILYMYGDSDEEMEQAMNTSRFNNLEKQLQKLKTEYSKKFLHGN
jgi:hypothetical protein